MTINEIIMRLVMLAENPRMPKNFSTMLDEIIDALSELDENSFSSGE